MPITLHFGRRIWSASWWMALLTLGGVLLFVSLGRWQWHRAAQKQALTDSFARGSLRVDELGGRSTSALPRYAQVRVQGRYDPDHQFLLDNISHAGRAGYDVLTPLRLEDGRTLIVNRGWIVLTNRRLLPNISLADRAPLTVVGRLDELPVTGLAMGRAAPSAYAAWPKITSFPDMGQLATALGTPLESRQLLLDARQPSGYARDWQPASAGFGPARHLSYAVQWWGLGALAVFLFVFMNLQREPR